jgi:hypothetical protein
MRDDQVRRYARHILIPDVGGLGQTALLVATGRIAFRESEPDAELVAAMYLAAGGVGKLVLVGATDAQLAVIAAHGPDTIFNPVADAPPALAPDTPPPVEGTEVALHPKPAWWPSAPGDTLALAYWRGSLAATQWMAAIANA